MEPVAPRGKTLLLVSVEPCVPDIQIGDRHVARGQALDKPRAAIFEANHSALPLQHVRPVPDPVCYKSGLEVTRAPRHNVHPAAQNPAILGHVLVRPWKGWDVWGTAVTCRVR